MTKAMRIYAIAFNNIDGERFVTFYRFDPNDPAGKDVSRDYRRCSGASMSRFVRAMTAGDVILKSRDGCRRVVRRIDQRAYHDQGNYENPN